MSDWPPEIHGYGSYGVLSTAAEGSPVADALSSSGTVFNTTAGGWTTANTAVFCPVIVRAQVKVYQLAWINGATSSGNVDAGIYDRAGNLIVAAGSTVQGTVSVPQLVDIADTTLVAGLYYLAFVADNTSSTVSHWTGAAPIVRSAGAAQMASAFPLPATATFAGFTYTFGMPLLAGATVSSVI